MHELGRKAGMPLSCVGEDAKRFRIVDVRPDAYIGATVESVGGLERYFSLIFGV